MIWAKLRLFILKYKIHQIALALVGVALLAVVFIQFIFPGGYFYQIEYVSIWGTLFGALIGGFFTLLGTQFASQKEIKGRFYIKQKNEILSPLYNELKEIHEIVLPRNPYPYIVSFEKDGQTMIAHPQYVVWGNIKIDTRYFETPKNLATEMENLYNRIEKYREYRPIAAKALGAKINEILLATLGLTCPIINLGDTILPYMTDEQFDNFSKKADSLFFLGNEKNPPIADEDKSNVYKTILRECDNLLEMVKLKSMYSEWIEKEVQVIELLRVLIESTNYRYHE